MIYPHEKHFSTLPQSTVLSLIYTIEEEYRIQNSEFRIKTLEDPILIVDHQIYDFVGVQKR